MVTMLPSVCQMSRRQQSAKNPARSVAGGQISIGALSRATGIAIETLRTWERRYGYPVPQRKPSGHRVYPVDSIPRLRRVAQALARGLRAGDVVSASVEDLSKLLAVAPALRDKAPADGSADTVTLLEAVATFNADRLTNGLRAGWGNLGPLEFLSILVAPLIHAVGERWARGDLGVHHEHFLSERLGDLLRTFRAPFEERASGPMIVCSTMSGEMHGLGLQMAALVLSVAGCRTLYLGTDVPLADIATLGRDLGAAAVALSVSLATRGAATTRHIEWLRRELPRRTALAVGGAGAPAERPGIQTFQDLDSLHAWARRLAGTA